MAPLIGWLLAIAALVVGYTTQGWQGLILAVTVIAFWLVLQLNKALRVMRGASSAPVGHVPSAVMLNAKLHAGMKLLDVTALTHSLGKPVTTSPEVFEWYDETGSWVNATFVNGRLTHWALHRPPDPSAPDAGRG